MPTLKFSPLPPILFSATHIPSLSSSYDKIPIGWAVFHIGVLKLVYNEFLVTKEHPRSDWCTMFLPCLTPFSSARFIYSESFSKLDMWGVIKFPTLSPLGGWVFVLDVTRVGV